MSELQRPTTECDFIHKGTQFWFKQMITKADGSLSALMECPVTSKLMVCRPHSGWYYVAVAVQKEYENWRFESIVLGDQWYNNNVD